jgi:hypothetical protein
MFETFTEKNVKIVAFLNVTNFSLYDCQHFEGICCLRLRGKII